MGDVDAAAGRIERSKEKLVEEFIALRVVFVIGTGVSVALTGNQKVDGHAVATWT